MARGRDFPSDSVLRSPNHSDRCFHNLFIPQVLIMLKAVRDGWSFEAGEPRFLYRTCDVKYGFQSANNA